MKWVQQRARIGSSRDWWVYVDAKGEIVGEAGFPGDLQHDGIFEAYLFSARIGNFISLIAAQAAVEAKWNARTTI